jgi:hypothetical protein
MKDLLKKLGVKESIETIREDEKLRFWRTQITFSKDGETIGSIESEETGGNVASVFAQEREDACRLHFFEILLNTFIQQDWIERVQEALQDDSLDESLTEEISEVTTPTETEEPIVKPKPKAERNESEG